jgi:protein-S-isoprenylcysteine O-methyltransferase Ste14
LIRNRLFWQALFAFLVLPGMVAFVIPLVLLAPSDGRSFNMLGVIPLGLGVVLLLWCVRDFYVAGKGTLAPWTPPQELVAVGLYRLSRNPMYIAVILVLLGWAFGFQSRALAFYALALAIAFQLRVVLNEEPFLARTHGERWTQYRARVPRWFGRR